MHVDDDELPADPDLAHVPADLRLLAGLNHGQVTVLDEDGVSSDTLVLVPGLWGHLHRLAENE